MRLIRLAPLLATAIVLAGLFASPLLDRLDGFSIDSLLLLRQTAFGPLHPPADSPTVIIAIDEDTAEIDELSGLPLIMLTPQFSRVIDAVNAAGAKLIGFDLVLPSTAERFLPEYDRPFLLSLKRAADDGRLVLAKIQNEEDLILPSPQQSAAVGHSRNIRAVHLEADDDGVVRRAPLVFESRVEGGPEQIETSFALELASRAGEFTPVLDRAGLTFGPTRVPGSETGSILLNFDGGAGAIPTYSFADLALCAAEGNMTYFKRAFADKIVLFGSVLNINDQQLTSKRFMAGREFEATPERCALADEGSGKPAAPVFRNTVPSVFVHATAINNLLQGDALSVTPRVIVGLIVLVLCLAAGFLSQARNLLYGMIWLGAGAVVWLIACVGALSAGLVLPLVDIPIAGVIGFAVPAGIRLAITDRERNRVRRAFSRALAPAAMERLLTGGRLPTLGGETRTVTILHLDIEGLGEHAEGLPPKALVGTMRSYLDSMSASILAHAGYVDTYVGESVRAVFGAPLEDTDHALNAVRAAMACRSQMAALDAQLDAQMERALRLRVGISSGSVIVGDIGVTGRFNYTALGDAVALADRLRMANSHYGTAILAAYDTVASCGDRIAFREIDRVVFDKRGQASSLFEPMADEGMLTGTMAEFATAYSLALADYRAGRFAEAAERYAALADNDPASEVMAERCRRFVKDPPIAPWQGVVAFDGV